MLRQNIKNLTESIECKLSSLTDEQLDSVELSFTHDLMPGVPVNDSGALLSEGQMWAYTRSLGLLK